VIEESENADTAHNFMKLDIKSILKYMLVAASAVNNYNEELEERSVQKVSI